MVLVVHSITNKTGKSFCPTILYRSETVVSSLQVVMVIHSFVVTFGTCVPVLQGVYLRIVQWILKIPLGILSYTLRIIQQSSPEGGPKDPRILFTIGGYSKHVVFPTEGR